MFNLFILICIGIGVIGFIVLWWYFNNEVDKIKTQVNYLIKYNREQRTSDFIAGGKK